MGGVALRLSVLLRPGPQPVTFLALTVALTSITSIATKQGLVRTMGGFPVRLILLSIPWSSPDQARVGLGLPEWDIVSWTISLVPSTSRKGLRGGAAVPQEEGSRAYRLRAPPSAEHEQLE
ncbi:hypothetical protein BO94DRAFT_533062 [Aspergillus sclerotioniger CBS 115572]|uniref:Uncharacterized protein n=1 Tax=Aspergillus sclerotioniger CBS 115572 TaxID=1450535 RepID=A0A317X421_9EURO|nr:hypothetical protein BO94DRAFT_533062 [Aspergillus sclerotioniger CBS 115572]PWY93323.1 hypothetical protein BO94DRAFT_533062 [Aspergillus sclerotioniger CBS 115572]